MSSWRQTEALTTVRQSADDPRAIEGIALPYNTLSGPVDLDGRGTVGQEVHLPGAARESVEHWMGRQDGGRMPYRPRHGERPVGTVSTLEDTPDGVIFRANIFDSPAGDAYLSEVAAGINGVSVEFGPGSVPTKRMRDGTVVHQAIKLHAIAGSDHPGFDGARISLRDSDLEPDPPPDEAAAIEPQDPPEGGSSDSGDDPVSDATTPTDAPEAPADATPAVAPVVNAGPPAADPPPIVTLNAPTERSAAPEATTETAVPMPPAVRDWVERNGAALTFGSTTPARVTRQPGVYGRASEHNFLRDLRDARQGDSAAMERQSRHQAQLTDIAIHAERAGELIQSEIPGALPNEYMPGLLTPRILKGRPMGSFFERVPISDSRPRVFAKVTTSGSVAVQSAEGAALTATDIATTAVTATPLMYGTYIDVSRQVIDSADPSAQQMVINDLIEAYAQASEAVIKTAVEAGSTASGVAVTAATPYAGILANVINYYGVRFNRATGAFIPSALYSVLLSQGDTTGRPFLPMIGASNSDGTVLDGGIQANVLGAATYLSYASTTNVNVFARPSDFVIFESSVATFSYDQVVGPQAVRIGLWAYLVVGARLGSLKVTAA